QQGCRVFLKGAGASPTGIFGVGHISSEKRKEYWKGKVVWAFDVSFDAKRGGRLTEPEKPLVPISELKTIFERRLRASGVPLKPTESNALDDYIKRHNEQEIELASTYNLGPSAADRKQIEQAAIECAIEFLKHHLRARNITSREKDKCGWDLEADTANGRIRV